MNITNEELRSIILEELETVLSEVEELEEEEIDEDSQSELMANAVLSDRKEKPKAVEIESDPEQRRAMLIVLDL